MRPDDRARARAGAIALGCLCALAAAPAAAEDDSETFARIGGIEVRGDGPNTAQMGIGAFSFIRNDPGDHLSAAGTLEARLGEKWGFIGPAVGVMANSDGAVYGYAGAYADFAYRDIVVTPFAGLGGYHRGDSKPLGGTFQFRVSLEVAYEFRDASRLGVRVAHLSNAYIHDENPGEEEILLVYTVPFGN